MNGLPWTVEGSGLVTLAGQDPSVLRAGCGEPASGRQETAAAATAAAAGDDGLAEEQPGFSPTAAGLSAAELTKMTKAMCRGDEAAFTQFYDLYSFRLYRYLLVLAKGNESEASEVLQTAVVKVARTFKVFSEERRMWAWLCRLARNAYVDLCRARRRAQRFVPLEEHKSELAEGPAGADRLSESLRHALAQLTVEEQELLRAAYQDECPLGELARASGQSYKAMESRLGRLRRKLKTNLLSHLRQEL